MSYALQELQIPPTGTKSPRSPRSAREDPSASDPSVIRDRRSALRALPTDGRLAAVPSPRPSSPQATPLALWPPSSAACWPVRTATVTGVTPGLPGRRARRPLRRPARRHAHGAGFAAAAREAGAVAVLTDRGRAPTSSRPTASTCRASSSSTRAAVLGRAAALVYGTGDLALRMFGVTGTNGKTTTAYLLNSALRGARPHAPA